MAGGARERLRRSGARAFGAADPSPPSPSSQRSPVRGCGQPRSLLSFPATPLFSSKARLGLDVVDAYIGLGVMLFIGLGSKTR